MTAISPAPDGVRLRIRVQPRATRTQLAGVHGDALRIRLQAPPVDGAANKALVRFVSGLLGTPRSAVTIAAGASSRDKMLLVRGVTVAEAQAALSASPAP